MRRKQEAVLCFESNDDGLPKVVRDYRDRYRAISQVLDDNPKILSLVHTDLLKLSEGDSQGREGDYTSENILPRWSSSTSKVCPFAIRSSASAAICSSRSSRGCGKDR